MKTVSYDSNILISYYHPFHQFICSPLILVSSPSYLRTLPSSIKENNYSNSKFNLEPLQLYLHKWPLQEMQILVLIVLNLSESVGFERYFL